MPIGSKTRLWNSVLTVAASSQPELVCPPNCRRCIDACPTRTLSEPLTMDRGRCIPQLCFNAEDLLTKEVRENMGTWLYGCDICQDVCPLNKNKWKAKDIEFPRLNAQLEMTRLENIFLMDEATYHNLLHPRYWYIPKEKIWLWRCNALRAMVNSGDPKYHKLICEAPKAPDEHVRKLAMGQRESG